MIPDRDYYADKNGKLTTDPEKFASQVAVKGFFLDERIAKRFGITGTTANDPKADRRITGRNAASLQIKKAADGEIEPEEPQESADVVDDQPETDELEVEEPKAAASKETVAKAEGDKKK